VRASRSATCSSVWPAALEVAKWPFRSTTWVAAMSVVVDRELWSENPLRVACHCAAGSGRRAAREVLGVAHRPRQKAHPP
jgi:hypothetical protein